MQTSSSGSHTPVVQSSGSAQPSPGSQRGQIGPPQPCPLASPLSVSSSHVSAEHVSPSRSQTPLVQSPPAAHPRSSAQSAQDGPPQSTSVSSSLSTPSSQAAATHVEA